MLQVKSRKIHLIWQKHPQKWSYFSRTISVDFYYIDLNAYFSKQNIISEGNCICEDDEIVFYQAYETK